jgi:hypothetical protein
MTFPEAFVDELDKLGGSFISKGPSSGGPSMQRKMYYQANKERLKKKNKVYRQTHGPMIARKKSRYRKQVAAGSRRPQKRVNNGMGYTSMGSW